MAVYAYSLDTNSIICLIKQQDTISEDGFCAIMNPVLQEDPFSDNGEYPIIFVFYSFLTSSSFILIHSVNIVVSFTRYQPRSPIPVNVSQQIVHTTNLCV